MMVGVEVFVADGMLCDGGPWGANDAEKCLTCRLCPARLGCLVWAFDHDEPVDVWGGFTSRERAWFGRDRCVALVESQGVQGVLL